MAELYKIISAILSGVKNPTMAAVGAVLAIFTYSFWGAIKEKLRREKAQQKKEEDKQRNQDELENSNQEGDSTISDRLRNRS